MNSNCCIVYMCRNPLDQFISQWKFWVNGFPIEGKEPPSLHDTFEMVCEGIKSFGPIWEHVLGYWKASKEQPHKILFLKYEDLKEDINFYVKRLTSFLGYPFSEDEEKQGVMKEISKFCSFDNIKTFEVKNIKKDIFYRKGEVGDWKNCLTASMAKRLEKIIEEKLSGSGLNSSLSCCCK
ncbi:hypothetical protein Patl1_26832 [Pistacia atlantica]|uniref:Uncharacterized protein n=1 Tax=Pistacia atlantica TaxID=434234 RepID=A0ACC1B3K5_9ROSI|nr:hypothetical protein Patl1_26832 [Pistacia atlantica]